MISEREWSAIAGMVTKMVKKIAGERGNLITSTVIKRDSGNRLVWIKELGDQGIPVVGFDYNVKYYDTDNNGNVNVKNIVVHPHTPDVGDHVLVALELGSQSLPRCVGVIQGNNWIIPEDESL